MLQAADQFDKEAEDGFVAELLMVQVVCILFLSPILTDLNAGIRTVANGRRYCTNMLCFGFVYSDSSRLSYSGSKAILRR